MVTTRCTYKEISLLRDWCDFDHLPIVKFVIGDPDDSRLRKVEMDVLIPKKMREKAKAEKCKLEVTGIHDGFVYFISVTIYLFNLYNDCDLNVVTEFSKCAKEHGLSMVVKCRNENSIMQECLGRWFHDEEFKNICTQEYLNERSEYRRTGIGKQKNKHM